MLEKDISRRGGRKVRTDGVAEKRLKRIRNENDTEKRNDRGLQVNKWEEK